MNEIRHVSASQITTYQRCARKHWLEKVAGVQVPTNAGAAFGTRCHAVVEQRILTGAWPDDAEAVTVAMAGWKFVPQEPTLLVEQELSLLDAPLPIVGRIDLVAPESSVIIDHKFMSSLRYVKTPEQLRLDPQAILYCTWAFREGYLRSDQITFRHLVYQTKGVPQATTSQVQFLPRELEGRYADLCRVVESIAQNSQIPDEASVPSAMGSDDESPCKQYGGCPHLARCTHTAGRTVWASLSNKEKNMNVLEKLAQKRQQQTAVGDVNPPEAGTEPETESLPPATEQQALSFDAPTSPAPAPAPAPYPDAEHTGKVDDPFALSTLYIGCLPANEDFVLLEQWLAPLQAEAAQALGVDYYAQAEYGKGKTALAALVLHRVKANGVPSVMVADPRLPSSDAVLDVLRPHYRRIVLRFS